MKVSDIMTKDVTSVAPETTVSEVAKLMYERNVSGVPVVNSNNEIIGIITEADLVVRNAKLDMPTYVAFLDTFFFVGGTKEFEAELRHVMATRADDLMTKHVYTIDADASVEDLATLMVEKKVNPVPVVDSHHRLVGIASRSDIVRLMAQGLEP